MPGPFRGQVRHRGQRARQPRDLVDVEKARALLPVAVLVVSDLDAKTPEACLRIDRVDDHGVDPDIGTKAHVDSIVVGHEHHVGRREQGFDSRRDHRLDGQRETPRHGWLRADRCRSTGDDGQWKSNERERTNEHGGHVRLLVQPLAWRHGDCTADAATATVERVVELALRGESLSRDGRMGQGFSARRRRPRPSRYWRASWGTAVNRSTNAPFVDACPTMTLP